MTILEKLLEKLPREAQISSTSYEGANIILYTKSKTFFLNSGDIIRQLVDEFKKRIELRADSSIRKPEEDSEKIIKTLFPKDAEVTNIVFLPSQSQIIVEAKNPGKAIGKDGENLKKIKEKTCWTPFIKRESIVPSNITNNIRKVLYEDNAERRNFLNDVGKRIYEVKKAVSPEKWARLSVLGGGRQVGRSCFLLQTPESKVLIDCGINPAGTNSSEFPYLTAPELRIQDLDAVIVSHAHLDHSGFVPYLYKFGYRGPVYCTAPTRDVSSLSQLDYIQVSHAQTKNAPYSSTDIKEAVKRTIVLDYNEVTDITPDVRITLYNAGHILGSAMVHLHIGEGWHNILYTGDFKTKETKLLNPGHSKFPRVETLITESTYGKSESLMAPRQESEKELCEHVQKTIKRKGKVLIPVLGVVRAQEVMIILEEFFRKNKINVPLYIDGMVWDMTAIHSAYPEYLNNSIREKIFYKDKNPLLSKLFNQVGSAKERKQIIEGGPCVVLATSGMLVGGPSVEYLKNFGAEKKNSIVFVSYQAVGSLGNNIQRGDNSFSEDGKTYNVNLEVNTVPGLSGHSDHEELLTYVRKMSPHPRRILVVHGENTSCLNLASAYHKEFHVETTAPRNLDSVRLR